MSTLQVNIDLNFKQIAKAAQQLSPEEKLKLETIMWKTDVEIDSAQQRVILDRIEKAKNDSNRLLDWDEYAKKRFIKNAKL
ncbi:MAG: hypothetical protein V4683_17940 [Bacteroidota bacterium]